MAAPDQSAFGKLTDRQRAILRHVDQGLRSSEIATLMAASPDAIDKQCKLACEKLNCPGDRRRAARLFTAHEAGVQPSDPPAVGPVDRPFFPLPLPVPTKSRPTNEMDWRQVLAWGVLIALGTPVLLTVAAMLLSAIGQLVAGIFGHPSGGGTRG